MPNFAYTGRTRAGQTVSGERAADTMDAAFAALRREQIQVTRITPAKGGEEAAAKKAEGREARQEGRRQEPGGLHPAVLRDDRRRPAARAVPRHSRHAGRRQELRRRHPRRRAPRRVGRLARRRDEKHPKTFDPLFTNMIAAGEAGGILDTILKRLATYIEKAVKLAGQVKSAMIYPIAVVVIAGVVVGVILWKVIPTFAALFSGLGADLPLPTRIVIGLSNNLVQFFPVLFVVGGAAASTASSTYYGTDNGPPRDRRASLLKMPILGNIMRKIAVARFCRTLSTLISSGVPILDGLEITAKTAGNAIVEDAIMVTRKSIERGETISAPLKETEVFPPMVTQMIGVGEATGALDTMLAKIADFYEEEVDTAVAGLLTLLEPIMIAVLGVVVGGIVIAMYMPIFDLISKLT